MKTNPTAFKFLLRVMISFVGGAAAYSVWMVLFLLIHRWVSPWLLTAFWLLGPLVTAIGFAAGLWLGDLWFDTQGQSAASRLVWPLIGCAVGAGLVFWHGPMLIVFGMLTGGAVAVLLREFLRPGHTRGRGRGPDSAA